jgi:PEGA domain
MGGKNQFGKYPGPGTPPFNLCQINRLDVGPGKKYCGMRFRAGTIGTKKAGKIMPEPAGTVLQLSGGQPMVANTCKRLLGLTISVLYLLAPMHTHAQQSPATGEVRFTADDQDERDAGVWIDGKYAGYVKELKGDRKVLLSPGEHDFLIRQAGYKDFTKKIVVAADQPQTIAVVLEENPKMTYPGSDAAQLRLDIQPKRAAVFVDGSYMGHGGDFGGRFHSMLVSPGKHHIKVTLGGYKPYETDIDELASSKTQMKIVLEKGSNPPEAQ